MSATIKDIAQRVGVSPSTVSRVINGTASIGEETKKKIYEAMKELDYHANSQARNLANGSTGAIGLIIDAQDEEHFSNSFFNRSVYAIEKVAQSNGYNLIIANSRDQATERLILERQVDGIIFPSSYETENLIETVCDKSFPYIILGEPASEREKRNWIDINNTLGGEQAAAHLVDMKYQKIEMLVENKDTVFTKNRMRGFFDELSKSGYEIREDSEFVTNTERQGSYTVVGDDVSNTYDIVMRAMKLDACPDAFLCNNNVIAYHTLRALKDCGKKVPSQVGVMTFDNYPLAEYMDPPLSVIDVDTYTLGERAAKNLISRIKSQNNTDLQTVIATRTILRSSTER